jgi:hypothetical protein
MIFYATSLFRSNFGSPHLGDTGAIVANAEFERGIVKLQIGQEPSLTRDEKHQIRRFLRSTEADDEVE